MTRLGGQRARALRSGRRAVGWRPRGPLPRVSAFGLGRLGRASSLRDIGGAAGRDGAAVRLAARPGRAGASGGDTCVKMRGRA